MHSIKEILLNSKHSNYFKCPVLIAGILIIIGLMFSLRDGGSPWVPDFFYRSAIPLIVFAFVAAFVLIYKDGTSEEEKNPQVTIQKETLIFNTAEHKMYRQQQLSDGSTLLIPVDTSEIIIREDNSKG